FFFEGAPNASAPHDSLSMAQIDDFVSDPDGLRLIEALMRVDNATLRLRIVILVQEIPVADDWDAWPGGARAGFSFWRGTECGAVAITRKAIGSKFFVQSLPE